MLGPAAATRGPAEATLATGGGYARTGGAPVSSAEGDVLLLGENLTFKVGQFLALQTASQPATAATLGHCRR